MKFKHGDSISINGVMCVVTYIEGDDKKRQFRMTLTPCGVKETILHGAGDGVEFVSWAFSGVKPKKYKK